MNPKRFLYTLLGKNPHEIEKHSHKAGFGVKSIGWVGGYSMLINNIMGPALITVPVLYQTAGWLLPTIAFVVIGLFTCLASCFLCEAMACVPGNENFQGRVEFSTLARFFFGKKGHIIAQIFINVSLQSLNIASIIISAQVMDDCLIAIFKRSCGVSMYPKVGWTCVDKPGNGESPFGGTIMFVTAGYLATLGLTVPMGYLTLDENIFIQVVCFGFLILVILNWIITFLKAGLHTDWVPLVGPDLSNTLANVLFNFGFITTVPSWVNEKKESVNATSVLLPAVSTASVIFVCLGLFGSMAFKFAPSSDLLSTIDESPQSNLFNLILTYMFPIFILAFSIPVYTIVVRYNLLQNKVCSKPWAYIFSVILPWLVVIPFMTGSGLMEVINWGSLFFTSVANFILPFVLYLQAVKFRDRWSTNTILTDDQLNVILQMRMDSDNSKRVKSSVNAEEVEPFLNELPVQSSQDNEEYDATPLPIEKIGYTALPKKSPINPKIIAFVLAFLMLTLVLLVIISDFVLLFKDNDNVVS